MYEYDRVGMRHFSTIISLVLLLSGFWATTTESWAQDASDPLVAPYNGTCNWGKDCGPLTKLDEATTMVAEDTLEPFIRREGCGINYAASWVKLSNRTEPYTNINPRLTLTGITAPNGVEVLEAYLYWIVESNNRNSSLTFSGPKGSKSVAGELIGLGRGGKCWPCNFTGHFRADVTDLICPNDPSGEYTLSDYPAGHKKCQRPPTCPGGFESPNGCREGDTDGVLLIVIYKDYSANYYGKLAIDNGCVIRLGGQPFIHNLQGGSICGLSSEATGFLAIGDFQAGSLPPHNISIGNATFPVQPRFFNFEASPLSTNSPLLSTRFRAENTAGGDCFSVIVAGVYARSIQCTPACTPQIVETPNTNGKIDSVSTCLDGQPITLNLKNHKGEILRWEEAKSCDSDVWRSISIKNPSLTVNNPSSNSCWRVVLKNDGCLQYSALGRIKIDNQSQTGSVGPSQKICAGEQPQPLTLLGTNGSVVRWESATTDNCNAPNLTWTTTQSTQNSFLPPVPTASQCWRAVVRQGECAQGFSTPAFIEVLPAVVAGSLQVTQGDCSSGTVTELRLTGQIGAVRFWEFAPTCAATNWQTLNLTGIRYQMGELAGPGCYRVGVGVGDCETVFTDGKEITSQGETQAGRIEGITEICETSTPVNLQLTGFNGSIEYWEWSNDNFRTSRNRINNKTAQLSFPWPSQATNAVQIRASVKLGDCAAAMSPAFTINKTSIPNPPTISGDREICGTNATARLAALGLSGPVLFWEFKPVGGADWNRIETTTESIISPPLSSPTDFRVWMSGNGCPDVVSQTFRVGFISSTVPGTVSGGGSFCDLTNRVTLTASGFQGQILYWEQSNDPQSTNWTRINQTTSSITVNLATSSIWYRAFVKNGSCVPAATPPVEVALVPPPISGVISGPSDVCQDLSTFTLLLSGNNAPVMSWQYSNNGGFMWFSIANTTQTLTAGPISQETLYRVRVGTANCPQVFSEPWKISVKDAPVGGQLTGGKSGCGNDINAVLKLNNYLGNILRWESQPVGSSNWNTINWTSDQLNVNTLSGPTKYRVLVTQGDCPPAFSSVETILAEPPSIGGTLGPDATVCRGQPSTTMTLSNHSGNILGWYFSKDNGQQWYPMGKAGASSLRSGRLTEDMWFRVEVQNNNCPAVFSTTAIIRVRDNSRAGFIFGEATLCEVNSGTKLELVSSIGRIDSWDQSFDGKNWARFPSQSTTFQTSTIVIPTWFRAVISNNGCSGDTTQPFKISLSPQSVGGTLATSRSICSGGVSGLLQLQGQQGQVRYWEVSENNGSSWTTLGYKGQSFQSDPLYQTSWYRVGVQNDHCPVIRSSIASITLVNQLAGGSITGGPSYCSADASLELKLAGSSGIVTRWEFSTNNGNTWAPIANTNINFTLTNLNQTTDFRALIESGSCPGVWSKTHRIYPRPSPTVSASFGVGCEGYGEIQAKGMGGTGGFAYMIDPLIRMPNSTGVFSLLPVDEYDIIVQDGAGCRATTVVDLRNRAPSPEILGASFITPSSAAVYWSLVPGNGVRYKLSYRIVGQPEFTVIESLKLTGTFLSGLQHDSSYEVRIEATCGGATLPASQPYFFRTLPDGDCISNPPPTPGGFYVDQITPFSVMLHWTPIRNLSPLQGYIVSFGKQNINTSNWPQLVVCAPDSNLVITGFSSFVDYGVRIRTNCSNCTTALQSIDKRSVWSKTIHFKTLAFRTSEDQEDHQNETLNVYPNPARSQITIDWPEAQGSGTLELFNSNGELTLVEEIDWKETIELDLPPYLAEGLYVLRLKDGRGKFRNTRLMLID